MNYGALLKDPRWQKRRLDILQRDGFTCQKCLDQKSTLHIHHKYYTAGLNPWEYGDDMLITLCEECHRMEHFLMKQQQRLIKNLLANQYFNRPSCVACGNENPYNFSTKGFKCEECGWDQTDLNK